MQKKEDQITNDVSSEPTNAQNSRPPDKGKSDSDVNLKEERTTIPNSKEQDHAPHSKPSSGMNKVLLVSVILMGLLLIGVGGYFLGIRSNNKNEQVDDEVTGIQPTNAVSDVTSSATPAGGQEESVEGETTVSYAQTSDGVLLKIETELRNEVFEFPNNNDDVRVRIYGVDSNYEPEELTDAEPSDYSWSELVSRDLNDPNSAKSIIVSDNLFSYKTIPDSDELLFIVGWARSASDSEAGPWEPILEERDLYYFDGEETVKIMTFNKDNNDYSFPKIYSISGDGNYASLHLFGCWGCGGHQPETMLIDLQNQESKNLDKVLEFQWLENGEYQYKEYIVVECEEPGPGECHQDPGTLSPKIGTMN